MGMRGIVRSVNITSAARRAVLFAVLVVAMGSGQPSHDAAAGRKDSTNRTVEVAEIISIYYDPPTYPYMCEEVNCGEAVPAYQNYWYRGYCKNEFPDFAALAVFESQTCPPTQEKSGEALCASRYRIIRVLDAASDALRKEYIDVKERPRLPSFRYRPILIFGDYKDGTVKIKGYEDAREYFFPITQTNTRWMTYSGIGVGQDEFRSITDVENGTLTRYDIYSFHSIGTPYYNGNALDSVEKTYRDEYLIPEIKLRIERVGKDFNKLWRRLIQNRTTIKATPIKNDFAALGMIKDMRVAKDSKQKKMCVLDIGVETVVKNNTDIDSTVTICKYGDCPSLALMIKPLYFLGDFKSGRLVIESFVSTNDAFVFGDTIYDISMGFPFDEFLSYFLPSILSVDEYVLAWYFRDSEFMPAFMTEEIISFMETQPEQKKRIKAAILKDSLASIVLRERKTYAKAQILEQQFGYWAVTKGFNKYRCRKGGR